MPLSIEQKIGRETNSIRLTLNSLTPEQLEILLADLEQTDEEFAYRLLLSWRRLLKYILSLSNEGHVADQILRKFNDAGRRSPPWKPGSERPGQVRPQDGADGNRQNRWLFDQEHEYFATRPIACLVELKYVLQTFSMVNAPTLPESCNNFIHHPLLIRILGHELRSGAFLDPLTKNPVDFNEFKNDRRYIESGHVVPHAREGRHDIDNATLMLRSSNRMQADFTIEEALEFMAQILGNNGFNVTKKP